MGSMKIMLGLLKNKLEGELAGLQADLTNVPKLLMDYLPKRLVRTLTVQLTLSTRLPTSSRNI